MTNVRKMTATTIWLLLLILAISYLTYLFRVSLGEVSVVVYNLLNTRNYRLGLFHNLILTLSFWIAIIAAGTENIILNNRHIKILEPFLFLILFTCIIVMFSIVGTGTRINPLWLWFWIVYHLSLSVTLKAAFSRISKASGSPSQIKHFLKDPLLRNSSILNKTDRIVIAIIKTAILISLIALLISLVQIIVQNHILLGI